MTIKPPAIVRKPPTGSEMNLGGDVPGDFAAQWTEVRFVYPLYAALAQQFGFAELPHPAGELPPACPSPEAYDRNLDWLDGIDEKVRAYQIRQLPSNVLNASEQSLRAFIHRQLKKPNKTTSDRDKIDLLLTQYFALCAPDELYRGEIALSDVAQVLQPVLAEADATPLEWCEPLEEILAALGNCHSLRDLLEHGMLEQGRLLKDSAGCMFYDPAALVAFVRFNFLLRRAFIRMLHEDVSAVRQSIDALEAIDVRVVDCRRAGFSAAETTTQLRYYCENWRQPFHKDYTENSVTHAFEQLLALRADLEEAVGRGRNGTAFAAPVVRKEPAPPAATESETPAAPTPSAPGPTTPSVSRSSPSNDETHAVETSAQPDLRTSAAPTGAAEMEKCLEAIWEQLIAAPPSRGRSMSTVVLQDTKVLLSSWEVAAFVADGGQDAEDLRRAVVARALLAVATDQRKRSGELSALASALLLARSEVSYFQGRVEKAKQAKNTEAAVNLGISTKRLLSCMEESQKLQP